MKTITDFISSHRGRFRTEDGNVFVFSLSKVTRRWTFLEIIHERYLQASAAFVANTTALQALIQPGTHPVTAEQSALYSAGYGLSTATHLEIESFYLFAKILLDDAARAIEYYFGPVRNLPLDSHDDLTKSLISYAAAKNLKIPEGFATSVADLKKRISDYRDYQIAHEKSPRTMVGTIWGPDGDVRMAANRLYPKETDQQIESETLGALRTTLENYLGNVVDFIEANQDKTNLTLAS